MMPGMMHLNSCGCRHAAMKNEPVMAMRKIAEGDPTPSSRNCRAVPTMTAIMIRAYAVDSIWAHINCNVNESRVGEVSKHQIE